MAQSTLESMREASTGTLVVKDLLNFWDGKRVKPRQEANAEPVFEPATGNSTITMLDVKPLCNEGARATRQYPVFLGGWCRED